MILNAAATLVMAGEEENLVAGAKAAATSIDSGKAAECLNLLVEKSAEIPEEPQKKDIPE